MIKLIACDIDGTLLGSNGKIHDKNIETINKAIDKGILFVPTTGRTLGNLPEQLNENIGFEYIIFSNGAVVLNKKENKYIYENYIPKEYAIDIINYLKNNDITVEAYISGKGYFEEEIFNKFKTYNVPKKIIETYKKFKNSVENISEIIKKYNIGVEKIYLPWIDYNIHKNTINELNKNWNNKIYLTSSHHTNIEICPINSNKGKSVKKLCDYLNIQNNEVLILGDNLNDSEMFKYGFNSVAMENGEESIKNIADFVTLTNDNAGVSYAIEKFCF